MALPGVFSQTALDEGSRLLLSTFDDAMVGDLLDMACGCGVIATVLGKKNPMLKLTLCDVNAAAISSSIATLNVNELEGRVIASNVYSAVEETYDWIVSNPPFHDGLGTSYQAAEDIIRLAPNFLKKAVNCVLLPMLSYLIKIFLITCLALMKCLHQQVNSKFTKQPRNSNH